MKRKRGNPNWGNPIPPVPALLTEFEKQVRQMGLTKHKYIASLELSDGASVIGIGSPFPNGYLKRGG